MNWSTASSNCARRCATGSRRKSSAAWWCRSRPPPTIPKRRSARTCASERPREPAFADKALASNPYVLSVLKSRRPRRDALPHGPGDRRQRDRAVCRPAARQSAVPAAHLHDARRDPDLSAAAAEAAGTSLRRRLGGRPRPDHHAELRLYRAASPLRTADRGADGQDRRGPQQDLRRASGRSAGRDRALRSGALCDRGQPDGQRAVRAHRQPAPRRPRPHSRDRAASARRARPLRRRARRRPRASTSAPAAGG